HTADDLSSRSRGRLHESPGRYSAWDLLASEDRMDDAAAEPATDIRADLVALQQRAGGHGPWPVEFHDGEIRFVAGRDLSLARNAEPAGWIGGKQFRDPRQREPIKQRGQRCVNACDAAPDPEEVIALLHVGRGGGVVAADDVDAPVSHGFPQMLL